MPLLAHVSWAMERNGGLQSPWQVGSWAGGLRPGGHSTQNSPGTHRRICGRCRWPGRWTAARTRSPARDSGSRRPALAVLCANSRSPRDLWLPAWAWPRPQISALLAPTFWTAPKIATDYALRCKSTELECWLSKSISLEIQIQLSAGFESRECVRREYLNYIFIKMCFFFSRRGGISDFRGGPEIV